MFSDDQILLQINITGDANTVITQLSKNIQGLSVTSVRSVKNITRKFGELSLVVNQVTQTIRGIGQALQGINAPAVEFDKSLQELSAITGVSGEGLREIGDMAQDVKDKLMSSTEKTKLSGIAANAQVNVIERVKVNGAALTPSGKAVDIAVPTKTSEITNDSGFITSTQLSNGLDGKVDKETGKGLSTNDYTTTEKEKLRDIEAGATRNVVFVSGVLTGSTGSIGKSTHGCSEIGSVQAYVGGELVEVGIEIVEETVGSVATSSKINWYSNTAFTSSNSFRLRIVGK